MNALQALIFDVDGTLADTERDGHRVAFNRAFESHGLDWHWDVDLYATLLQVTGGKERIRHYVERFRPSMPRSMDLETLIAVLHAQKTEYYLDLIRTGRVALRPGVDRLLGEAREAGLRLAIATTTTPENVTALLASTLGEGAVDWFEVIAAGDMVPAKKPAPDIYLHTLERLALEPAQCLAFEDSAHGLSAARAAGLATIVTANGYTKAQDLGEGLLVVGHLGEPDMPTPLVQGDLLGRSYVDLGLLRELHARYRD